MTKLSLRQRVNITLPGETIRLIDRIAKKGDRSRFFDTAVRFYIKKTGRVNMRKQLKEGALRDASRDLAIAAEWFSIDEEAWQSSQK